MTDRADTLDQYLLSYAIDSDTEPTKNQISNAIKMIQQRFEHADSLILIQTLYTKLQAVKEKTPPFRILQHRNFDYHQLLKRKLAKTFFYNGYGYNKFKQSLQQWRLSFDLDMKTYNIICEGMVLQLYRALEKMLIRKGDRLKLKHRDRVKELNEWILNYSMFLQDRESQLLRIFFARCYGIEEVGFSVEEGRELYYLLQRRFDVFGDMDMEECLKDIDIDIDVSEGMNIMKHQTDSSSANLTLMPNTIGNPFSLFFKSKTLPSPSIDLESLQP